MKKIFKIIVPAALAFSCLFVYLAEYGENRFSLMLNQGASVPVGATAVTITKRRGLLPIFTNREYSAEGSCIVSKEDFSEWLRELDFQLVLAYSGEDKRFYTTYASLPEAILGNEISYLIQLKRNSTDVRHILVSLADNGTNVRLEYDMDRN